MLLGCCCCVCARLCLRFLWVHQWKPLMRLYIFSQIFQRFGVEFCSRNRMLARVPFSHKLFILCRGTCVQAIDFHCWHLASRLIHWLAGSWWLYVWVSLIFVDFDRDTACNVAWSSGTSRLSFYLLKQFLTHVWRRVGSALFYEFTVCFHGTGSLTLGDLLRQQLRVINSSEILRDVFVAFCNSVTAVFQGFALLIFSYKDRAGICLFQLALFTCWGGKFDDAILLSCFTLGRHCCHWDVILVFKYNSGQSFANLYVSRHPWFGWHR